MFIKSVRIFFPPRFLIYLVSSIPIITCGSSSCSSGSFGSFIEIFYVVLSPFSAWNLPSLLPQIHLPFVSIASLSAKATREIAIALFIDILGISRSTFLKVLYTQASISMWAIILAFFKCNTLELFHVMSGDTSSSHLFIFVTDSKIMLDISSRFHTVHNVLTVFCKSLPVIQFIPIFQVLCRFSILRFVFFVGQSFPEFIMNNLICTLDSFETIFDSSSKNLP